MNKANQRGSSHPGKRSRLPKSAQPASPLKKSLTPTEAAFSKWCTDICQSSDGSGTLKGLSMLGPINSFSDLLLPAAGANPQTILAAEQLVHLIEGWRYAAAATGALLSHSSGQALHLAYYAELRAAMSLFAWSGIRVKRNDFYYLDSKGQKQTVAPQKTHDAVWGLWNHWAQRGDAKRLFNDQIKLLPSVTLGEVISSVKYVNASATLASWGIDLWDPSHDHFARNSASYEAELTGKSLPLMKREDAQLILDIWKLFLSDGASLAFDAALVNYIVADAVPKLVAQSQENVKPTIQKQLNDVAVSISATTGVSESEILRRLDHNAYPSKPFALASAPNTNVSNVVCRGFFLLRMAMIAAKISINTAPKTAAKKWMENWLFHAGIWSPSGPVALFDLEEDYRLAVDGFSLNPPYPHSFWDTENVNWSMRLVRPDACIAWGLVA
ncbi:hypothetical protein [Achromobacter xylosoxidans]|uniref:hypothetical protein n=1 Tax=Alcaligenes xylosoxydans xylosoxydans TaxID=85698 RepID=UPI0006C6BE61|nr:hypothetical protein [Achromobacter xylosoxidans]MCH4595778.1 hypothetical protein [Achromobacter xylosoxidans]CUJ09939.1 Uncharacterised protein [Achromobacter xylosoxidans]